MVGRKRKSRAARHPCGQVVREKQLTKAQIAQRMPHRRGLPLDLIEHERAGTPFGRMRLNNAITEQQYQAGEAWRGVVMAYRAVLNAPSEFPRSIAGALMGGGGSGRGMTDEEATRRKSAYNEAHDAIMEEVGIRCLKALNDATVHERFVEPYRIESLLSALDVLVSLAYRARRRAVA